MYALNWKEEKFLLIAGVPSEILERLTFAFIVPY
jgi:hypothetical protein